MNDDTNVTPIEETPKAEKPMPQDDVMNLSMPEIKRKRIRINGDYNQIIELNLTDLTILNRLDEVYPKLKSIGQEVLESDAYIGASDDAEKAKIFLDKADKEMRELLDYLFDYPVCAVLVPSGSLFDPISGQFRFEYIIDKLSRLYETNFTREFQRLHDKLNKHTVKYSKKNKRRH